MCSDVWPRTSVEAAVIGVKFAVAFGQRWCQQGVAARRRLNRR